VSLQPEPGCLLYVLQTTLPAQKECMLTMLEALHTQRGTRI